MRLASIAVGVDFSAESDRAVAHALAIARHVGASLSLVHVAAMPGPYVGGTVDDGWRAVLQERLAEDRARLAELRERIDGQGVVVGQVVVDGYPDTGLTGAAQELGADLLVVGTHGRTGFRRVLLGSVAERTVRLSDASVLVARGDAPAGGYRRVVAGMDYSPLAWLAVQRALDLTARGGDVRVLHAWSAPYVAYDLGGRVVASLRAQAEAAAEPQRARLLALPRPEGVAVHLELTDRPPVAALEDASDAADLVVVGSHGHRGLRRAILGSVAEAVTRHARTAVLVAR